MNQLPKTGACFANRAGAILQETAGTIAQLLLPIWRTHLLFVVLWQVASPETRVVACAAETAQRGQTTYAIVAEEESVEAAPWKNVVESLQKKYSAKVFCYDDGGMQELQKELAAFCPDYVCFVARPDELARQARAKVKTRNGGVLELPLHGMYYHEVGKLMQSLDDDPYDDAIWAVLTGATPEDALRLLAAEPLTVRNGLSHVTSGWLQWFESGVSFNECKKGQKWVKMAGKPPEETKGPDDATEQFVAELNTGKVDMVSTSGHATEHDWQMGFTYRSGQIVTPSKIAKLPQAARDNYQKLLESKTSAEQHPAARLLGVDVSNNVYKILARNPKIYYSPGNCRIARVDGEDCMVLGWIHHGAMQFFGHVGLQTRSCYAWGVAEYFLALQGRFSFAEAVWLNQQALRWELGRLDEKERKQKYICCRNEVPFPAGRELFWETTVFYGDPAWEARVKRVVDPLYDQQMQTKELEDGLVELTFTVTMRRASLPSRPAAFLLETPTGSEVEVKEGPENLVVADNFALIPFWKPGQPVPEMGKEYKAVVVVQRSLAHEQRSLAHEQPKNP